MGRKCARLERKWENERNRERKSSFPDLTAFLRFKRDASYVRFGVVAENIRQRKIKGGLSHGYDITRSAFYELARRSHARVSVLESD